LVILGLSGRRIIEALIAGQTLSPGHGRRLAHRSIKATTPSARPSPRFHKEVGANVEPFRVAIEMLSAIPVSAALGNVIVSEIGIGMSRFPSASHRSVGRACAPKTTKALASAAPPLVERRTLAQVDVDSMRMVRKPHQWQLPQAQHLRLRFPAEQRKLSARWAASIITAADHLLRNGILYQDLGASYLDNRAKNKQVLRLVNRLKNLGFEMQIKSLAA
jgi:hypothetical protein